MMTKTKLLGLALGLVAFLDGGTAVAKGGEGNDSLKTCRSVSACSSACSSSSTCSSASMGTANETGIVPRTRVDFFAGAEFHYRDLYHNKLYEVLINLTPGVKWYMGHRWQLAGQAIVPVYNEFGARYRRVRLNMAVLSKEWNWRKRFFLKASGGLFGHERYGLDVKAAYIATPWLSFDVQAGCTGFCSMAAGWECGVMRNFTGRARARFYIPCAQTEIDLEGGRYIFADNAVRCEAMRHFRHCTIGVYAQYSDLGKDNYGFKVVMMIPPYRRRNTKVRVRPASAFRLTYNQNADPYSAKYYTTDPEENERESWFDRERFQWGANTQRADFRLFEFKKKGKKRAKKEQSAEGAVDVTRADNATLDNVQPDNVQLDVPLSDKVQSDEVQLDVPLFDTITNGVEDGGKEKGGRP